MDSIAAQRVLCLDDARAPRRLLPRAALLAFFAGALFLIGLLASQPARAAVANGTPVPSAGQVPAATVPGAPPAGTAAAAQAAGAANGAAHQAAAATASATRSVGSAAGQVPAAASRAVGTAVQAVGSAVGSATGLASGGGITGAGTGSGGGVPPGPHRHHKAGHKPHRHRARKHHGGQDGRRHRGAPGGYAGGAMTRRAAAAWPHPHGLRPVRHGAKSGGNNTPAGPSPAPPAVPVALASGSAAGGAEPHGSGHVVAGSQTSAAVIAATAAAFTTRHRGDWSALIRDERGPHRPG